MDFCLTKLTSFLRNEVSCFKKIGALYPKIDKTLVYFK
jgi:hypothetical protein